MTKRDMEIVKGVLSRGITMLSWLYAVVGSVIIATGSQYPLAARVLAPLATLALTAHWVWLRREMIGRLRG